MGSCFSSEIFNSEHLKTPLSPSLRRLGGNQQPGDFWKPLIGILSEPDSERTHGGREQGQRASRAGSCARMPSWLIMLRKQHLL